MKTLPQGAGGPRMSVIQRSSQYLSKATLPRMNKLCATISFGYSFDANLELLGGEKPHLKYCQGQTGL